MSSFKEEFAKCVVKDGLMAIKESTATKYQFGNKAWWGLPIKVHTESASCYCAEKEVSNANGFKATERYIIPSELISLFKKSGYKVSPRTCYIWKNIRGQHGVAFIHKVADTSYCVSGRESMALAQTDWYMFEKNSDTKTYDYYPLEESDIDYPEKEPDWHAPYMEMLEEAIAEMLVTSEDHPVAKELQASVKQSKQRLNIKRRTTRSPSKTTDIQNHSDANGMLDEILED